MSQKLVFMQPMNEINILINLLPSEGDNFEFK